MFGKTKDDKERERRLSYLRSHISSMDVGKRILLSDGRIVIFKGFDGGRFSGDSFSIEENGEIKEVPLELYDCLLVEDSNFKCPLCSSNRMMEGWLRGPDGTFAAFRENITSNLDLMPVYNSRRIILRACRDCGYVMPFVGVNRSVQNE